MKPKAFNQIKILDMTRYLPGGYATQLFADLGAEVIKVEDTNAGDFCRHEKPVKNGFSYYFTALGRNKKSVSLNLKHRNALIIFYRLAREADIVIESFRPGATTKLGVDYETLKSLNPQLIYCSLSGYGQNDPRSLKPLHDINMQAQSGYFSVNGGVKAPLHLCDLATGMVAAQSLLSALLQRSVSKEGCYIDISMFDSFVWWNSLLDSRWSFLDDNLTEDTIIYPSNCPFYNLYKTKDGGQLALGLVEDKFWKEFCELTNHPEIIDHTVENAYETVKEIARSKTTEEWDEWLADKNLCIATVVNKTDAINQILDLEPETMAYVDFPATGKTLQTNIPHNISGMRPSIKDFKAPPMLGENTREILKKIGYTDETINNLAEKGSIRIKSST